MLKCGRDRNHDDLTVIVTNERTGVKSLLERFRGFFQPSRRGFVASDVLRNRRKSLPDHDASETTG